MADKETKELCSPALVLDEALTSRLGVYPNPAKIDGATWTQTLSGLNEAKELCSPVLVLG